MRHLDIHAHDIWPLLAREFDGLLTIGSLTHHLISVVFEHGHQIHAVHRLVFGHDHGGIALGLLLGDLCVSHLDRIGGVVNRWFLGDALLLFVGHTSSPFIISCPRSIYAYTCGL